MTHPTLIEDVLEVGVKSVGHHDVFVTLLNETCATDIVFELTIEP